MSLLIENCSILDQSAAWGYTPGQYILIEGQRIQSVGSIRPALEAAQTISGERFLVIPGLINAHTHSPENLVRATDDRLPLEPWLVHLVWASGTFSERDHYLAAMVGIIEMLLSGTTAVLDHLSLPPRPNWPGINGAMRAYRDSGIRAGVAPMVGDVSYDSEEGEKRGHRLMGTVFESVKDERGGKNVFELLEHFFRTWHGSAEGRLGCWIGPSGVQWASLDFLSECLDLTARYRAGLHMHLMETRVQEYAIRQRFKKSAVAMLAEAGLLSPTISLPHSVWVTPGDIDLLARTGAVPVHNPAANLKLGSGLAPVPRMLSAGIIPGLGADGSKSSDHQNMFAHLHLAALIHNLSDPSPERWLSSREVVRMATEGGAAALNSRGQLGRIAPGYLADLTLLDLDSPSLTPLNDAFHHLVFTELGQSVHTVIIDGRLIVQNRKILTFDAKEILREARACVQSRAYRNPMPAEWQTALDRYSAYQRDIMANTKFKTE